MIAKERKQIVHFLVRLRAKQDRSGSRQLLRSYLATGFVGYNNMDDEILHKKLRSVMYDHYRERKGCILSPEDHDRLLRLLEIFALEVTEEHLALGCTSKDPAARIMAEQYVIKKKEVV